MTTEKKQGKPAPENTDAWIPEDIGDSLQGEVVEVDSAWSDWRAGQVPGDPDAGWYPLLTIKQDGTGALVKLHGFRTVLYNELLKRQPIPGEQIVVTYMGAGEAKNGRNAPEVYRVTVPGRPPEAARAVYGGMRRDRTAPGTGAPAPSTPAPGDGAQHEAPAPTQAETEAERDARLGDTLPT